MFPQLKRIRKGAINPLSKFLFCLSFLTLFSSVVRAQESPVAGTQEIGLNATNFINNFLSFNDRPGLTGAYLVNYRKYKGNNKAFRIGLDINTRILEDKPEDNNDRTSTAFNINARFGWEKQIPITARWVFLTGIDIITGYSFGKVKTETDLQNSTDSGSTFRIGTGPYAGIQFNLNDRMGFFTESTLYLLYSNTTEKFTSSVNSQDSKDKSSVIDLNLTTPNSIFFFIKF